MTVLVLLLETLAAIPAALFVILSFVFSPRRGRLEGLSSELPERFGGVPDEIKAKLAKAEVWWLHAASAGEVAGLSPLIEALSARKRAPAVVVTTTTRSGREAARALPGVAWAQLAPLDCWPCVSRFVTALSPRRLILAETELWPSTILIAHARGLNPALVNARLTTHSLARYRLIAPFLWPALKALTLVAAQTDEDGARFEALGVPEERILLAGSMKYDKLPAPAATEAARARVAALGWGESPVLVAGSTHPFEEEMVLGAYMAARRKVPELKLVLAPRHLERGADAVDLLRHAGLKVARWMDVPSSPCDALVLDMMGILPAFYGLARASFVGGTLVRVGGHNLLEPALAGSPVIFGPHTAHIERPAELLAAPGAGGRRVPDSGMLADAFIVFATDAQAASAAGAAAKATAEGLKGATARVLTALEERRG